MAINKLKRGVALWTLRGKTNKDSNIVRAVDVNKVIDEANTDITSLQNQINSLEADSFTYAEIAVSNAELLAIGSTPKQILAAPGANKYYDYFGVLEYTYIGGNFPAFDDALGIIGASSYGGSYIGKSILTDTQSNITRFNSSETAALERTTETVKWHMYLNEAINLTTLGATDPVGGGGTILVKIWYKVKTFGTEL
jgi:hypothetical protein